MPLPAPRPRALLETLEPRILYSADLAALTATTLAADSATAVHEIRLQTTTTVTAETTTTTEIAFVDLGIPDAATLVSGLQAQREAGRPIEVVGFAAQEDGLAVISRTLAERQARGEAVEAVHVFSHGRAGEVRLGAVTLDADSLLVRAGEIAAWGGALGSQADLLLYGCEVAAQASGRFLIEGLAALTGADVAASDDLTGRTAPGVGADWVLEQRTGTIEATVAAEAALQQTWNGVLGSAFQVNTTTSSQQTTSAEARGSQQTVAMDAAGNFVVVWTSASQDGSGLGVYVRRFAFDGTALTGEIRVNSTTTSDQQNARIVSDAAGNFAVVWSSSNQDGTPSSVYLRRFAADGTALTSEVRANATPTGSQSNAVIGMNTTNGDVVVAWQGDGPGAGANVFFRRFAMNGTALDATDRPVATSGDLGGEQNPVVAMDTTGRFVIAWERGGHVHCQRHDSAGVAAGAQAQVDTDLGTGSLAAVAMDASGNFMLAYRKDITGLGSFLTGLWAHAFDADGSSGAGPQFVDGGDATSGSISLADDGTAVVVYQKTGGTDSDGLGVYARRLGAAGYPQGGSFLVNATTAGSQAWASASVHDVNHFVVAWSGQGGSDSAGVLARTFEAANTAPLITTNDGGSTAAVTVNENTTAVAKVQSSDLDWPIQTVAYSIVGGADQAKFSIDSQTGALRFVLAPDFERPMDLGTDNVYDVTVQASDGLLYSRQALAVTVADVADQVVATPDTASTPHVTPVTVAVRDNDLLGTGTLLTLLDLVQPAHGTAALVGGQVRYTPAVGFVGTDTFSYRVIDDSEGVTHYWSLDDSGTIDAITGTAGSPQGGPTTVSGVRGQALQFDGVDDRVVLSDVAYTNEFTLSCWFKVDDNSGTGYRYLYRHADTVVQNSLNIYFIEDATNTPSGVRNVLRTALTDGNDAVNLAALDIEATAVADGRWHQYTLTTRTGIGSSVYIDGTLSASSTQGGDAFDPVGNLYLGAVNPVSAIRYFNGALDDLQLLDHATTATQVAAMSAGPGAAATVTVTVTPVNTESPVIVSDGGGGAAALTVAENGTAVTTVHATDADVPTPTLSYSIIGGADQAKFSIDSQSGAVAFLAAPDFEHPMAAGGGLVYDLTVQASDGVHVDVQALQVTVTDVNEHAITPITDLDAATDEVDENAAMGTTVGLTALAVDADGSQNSVVYGLDDSAGGRFAIDSASGVVTVAAAGVLDAEAAASHALVVRATSSDGSHQTRTYTLTVRDLNEAGVTLPNDANPVANAVLESAAIGTPVGLTAVATDADLTHSTVTYTLTNNAGGRFAIEATTGVVTVARALDAETAMGHNIVVQATSADGSALRQTFTIVVQDVNEWPVQLLGDLDTADNTVREDAPFGTVVGVQALAIDSDATNRTVTYSLDASAGGRFSIDPNSGVITVALALDAESATVHRLFVRATSSDGSTDLQSVDIAVQDVNEFPVTLPVDVDSAPDTLFDIASVGTRVGITALAHDADASLNQVTYTLADDAGGRFVIQASSGVVTLARSVAGDAGSVQTLVVQATSADGSFTTQRFSLAIDRANLFAPAIASDGGGGSAALAVLENTTLVTTVVVTDADVSLGPTTYTITGGADAARFALDSTSGVLRFAVAPDAEQPLDADGDHRYEVLVQVSDGLWTDTQALTVTVTDVNEAMVGPVADADAALEVLQENAPVGTRVGVTAQAADADATNNRVTYALEETAGGRFMIDADSGVVTVAGLLDAESAIGHTLVVRATSSDGSTTTRAWTLAVQDVDEFDVTPVSDTDPQADSVREDAPVGTVVGLVAHASDADVTLNAVRYALADNAGGHFAIDVRTGVVTVAQALDAESALSHAIVVQATSADGSTQSQRFTVTVQDVDEFDLTAATDTDPAVAVVPENAAAGTRVGVTVQAIDADATNNRVTYTLLDDADGRFAIDATSGTLTVAGRLDAETAQQYTVVVQSASSDGSLWAQAFTVAVTDVDEFDLVAIDDLDATPEVVLESVAMGTPVGVSAQGIDRDVTNSQVTYALDDTADGRFAIDARTGVVTVAKSLDAEVALSHVFVVRATSSDGSETTRAWTLSVQDVDEFDLVAVTDTDPAADGVSENAPAGTAVGMTALASDADVSSARVTYRLEDTAGGRFAVDASTGVVTLARAIQEEGVTSRTIVLRATSADGSTVAASFTLSIGLVNDAVPVIDSDGGGADAVVSVAEGQALVTQVSAHDTDLPAPAIRYALVGGADAAAFTLDATSGVLRFVVAPDADWPADVGADHVYDVTVQASDGQYTDEQALRITVQPVNDLAPRIVSDGGGATALRHVAENTVLAAQVQALDADLPADTLVYALAGGADAGLFTIDATRGELRWRAAPDREVPRDADADQRYEVLVSASDGLHVATQALTLVVDNVDEAPSLDSSTLAVVEGGTARPVLVATDVDTPAAQLVYTVQAVSGGWFESLAEPGMAVTRFTQADVEAGTLQFVTDGGEGAPAYRLVLADDTSTLVPQAAVVAFTPVNDAPEVVAVELGTVDEDQPGLITTAALLALTRDAEGDSLSVSALRLTGGEGVLVDLGGGRWRFDPAADWSGVATLAGEVGDGQASVALAASLQVRAVNDAPRIVSGDGAAVVALERVENTGVVEAVQGADIDRETALHYAVAGGADAALFRIDEATGALSFAQVPDHEHPADADGDNRYEVIVEVSDGELRAQQALVIAVTNLDEVPTILHNTLVITDGVVTLRLQASDPDTPATALTFQVEAVQDGQFERVSAPGEAVVQFTQADIDAARVVWVAPAGSVRGTYALRLSDGHSDVGVGAPVLERRSSAVTTTTLAVPTVAADDAASTSAVSAPVLPSALTGRRIEPFPAASAETSAEAGLGLGQGVTLEPVVRASPVTLDSGVSAEVRTLAMRVIPATEVEREDVVLDLLSERDGAPKWLMTNLDLWVSGSGSALAEQMDRLRHDVAEAQQAQAVSLASTALVSTGLSVGYVIWLVRGGVLMTSLMSAVPAWAGMDPLPVLAEMRRAEKGTAAVAGDDGDDDGDDPDPIEKLFSKARRLLVRPADTPAVIPETEA